MNHQFIQTNELPVTAFASTGTETREIARGPGPKGFGWRFSVSDISAPLTLTAGPDFERIVTVVEGADLAVKTPEETLRIQCRTAMQLPTGKPLVSEPHGAMARMFCLDFDPEAASASVYYLSGPAQRNLITLGWACYALYGVMGGFSLAGRRGNDRTCILLGAHAAPLLVEEGSMILIVRIDTIA